MAICGIYNISELAFGDKDFSEVVEEVVQCVNDGHQVHQGKEQLDTFFVILAMVEDDSDGVNEGLTYAVRGIGRDDFQMAFDEKLQEMAVEMVNKREGECHE
tara:strand:+ start:10935 stop:11240 length:306 start_codon:yes stop_codon:yes gene_type:complete